MGQGVEVHDSHGIRDRTRERTAKARAVPEHVIIIGKLGLPSDTGGHGTRTRRGDRGSAGGLGSGSHARARSRLADVKTWRSTFIVLPVVLQSLFLATGQNRLEGRYLGLGRPEGFHPLEKGAPLAVTMFRVFRRLLPIFRFLW